MNLTIQLEENNTKMKDCSTCTVLLAFQCVHVKDVARKLKVARTLNGVSRVVHNNRNM